MRETWDIYLLQGKRIGYGHTTVRHEIGSRAATGRRTESLNHLAVKRDGQTTRQDIRTTSVETPQGQLIRFESEMRMGPDPIRTIGRVEGDRLVMETTGADRRRRRRTRSPGRPTAAGRWPPSRPCCAGRCSPASAAR